ncbi:glycosyltransferase family 2 protein [Methylosoma difficile]
MLTIVIPLYNEAQALPIFWQNLQPVLADLSVPLEVCLIDDGSQDQTWQLIQQLTERYDFVRGLRFTRNFGKEAAILAGLQQAQGQVVVVMDGDGQHPPALLPAMLRAWQQGHALVVACKQARPSDSCFTRMMAWLFAKTMRLLSGLDLANSSDFRLLDRQVVDSLLACPEKIRFFRGMTVWSGFSCQHIDFIVPGRLAGESGWSKTSLVKMALQALVSYSAKPLYYLFGAGLGGLLVSFFLVLQALYSWIQGFAASGWTAITLLIIFFGSTNLLGLGLVGIYVGQLFDEIKARPAYLVRERSGEN